MQWLDVGGDRVAFRAATDEITAIEVRMAPGGGPPLLHRHEPSELYRVERGSLALYVEDREGGVRRLVAGPGDVVAIPGGAEHTIRNESSEEARALAVFAPGAPMAGFIRAAAAAAPEDVPALAERHGIVMTRPLAEVA
jgi:mannose-6-phosphate isomerase-like protein (cupin superfamily)